MIHDNVQHAQQVIAAKATSIGTAVSAGGAATALLVQAMPWLQALGVLVAIGAGLTTIYVNVKRARKE